MDLNFSIRSSCCNDSVSNLWQKLGKMWVAWLSLNLYNCTGIAWCIIILLIKAVAVVLNSNSNSKTCMYVATVASNSSVCVSIECIVSSVSNCC